MPPPLLYRIKNNQQPSIVTQQANIRLKRNLRSNSASEIGDLNKISTPSTAPIVIVKFAMHFQKIQFFNNYFQHGKLTLNNFGTNVPIQIIISENLTPSNYKVFRDALDAKKHGLFSKVSTFNGLVQVYDKENKRLTIRTLDELKKLLSVHYKMSSDTLNASIVNMNS